MRNKFHPKYKSLSNIFTGQINQAIIDLTRSCGRVVRSVDVSATGVDIEAQKQVLIGKANFVTKFCL